MEINFIGMIVKVNRVIRKISMRVQMMIKMMMMLINIGMRKMNLKRNLEKVERKND
jgi:hypothetical protein